MNATRDRRLDGRVAVVTGAAKGIGEAMARRFVEEGSAVVVADLDADRGAAVAAALGDAARFVRADVTVEADVAAAVDAAVHHFGRVDCVCNNAGVIGAIGPIVDTTKDDWDTTIAVLLTSVFFGIKHAARRMIAQGSGTIINTASTAGVHAGLGPHVYTAAKHGVVGLTKSVAPELARYGIRTNCIAPGGVVTAMTATAVGGDPDAKDAAAERLRAASPLGRAGLPNDIANVAIFLASDEAALVNGACLVVDGAAEAIASVARRFSSSPAGIAGHPS